MSEQKFIYHMKDLRKIVPPKREILKGIYLSFFSGAKIGVVGPNGSGKSSLIRIMAGVDSDFQGEAWAAKGTRIGYLPQEPELDPLLNVRGNVEEGVKHTRDLLRRFEEVSAGFADVTSDDDMQALIEEQARLQDEIDAAGAWELERKLEIAMEALRLPPPDADVMTLSGGERRRVALCKVLLQQPDILLLDEPTNHLDAESVAWLEKYLTDFPGTIVAITHDRYFLDNVAEWILELDRGEGIPWKGNYSSWLEQKRERLRIDEKQESARTRTLDRELEWVRMAPRARHSKGRARVQAYEELLAQDEREQARTAEILIPKGPRLGGVVIRAEGVSKGYGDRLLIEDLDLDVPPGAILGIIGPNGVGKTTLFRMITGQEQPDAGKVRVGETVRLAYVDQSRDSLDGEKSVYDEVSGPSRVTVRARRGERPRLPFLVRVPRRGPAEKSGRPVRRRAQPPPPGQVAQGRGECPPFRRAHQRPRCRYPACARRRDPSLRRVGVGDLTRPVVPGPSGIPHPGFRGRQLCGVISRQLHRV